MVQFDHERMHVYQASAEFAMIAHQMTRSITGRAHLVDQLHRSAASIPLNIAEGAGEFSAKEKVRFYRIALRSATESAATLDLLARLGAVDPDVAAEAKTLLGRIVAMLTRLCRKAG